MVKFAQRTFKISTSVVLTLALSLGGVPCAMAEESSQELTAKADDLAASSAQKQAEADSIASNIDGLQTSLNEAQARYDEATEAHDTAQAAADDARERKDAADARTDQLQTSLSARASEMYKTGGTVSFLNVILGAATFEEFITNWDAVNRIATQDTELIAEAKQVREEAASAQAEYEEQTAIAAQQMDEADAAKKEIETTKASMEAELAKVSEEVALLQGQEEEIREEAQAAKEREEYAAKVAAEFNASTGTQSYATSSTSDSNSGSSSTSASSTSASTSSSSSSTVSDSGSSYSSGGGGSASISGWVNPCPSYYGVTCEFGYSPITGSHTGIDLGASSGAPILAAGPGTVTYVGWYGTGGNAVIISHGNGIRTIYMHQSQTAATVGQSVSAGDVIGYVGTTGLSTGPHLHFTIEINGTNVNPRNYYSF